MISRMVSHRVGAGGRGSTRHIRTSLFLDGKSCGWCRRLLLDHGRWAMGDGRWAMGDGRWAMGNRGRLLGDPLWLSLE